MNQLDALLIVILLLYALRGYSLGFARAIFRLAGWVVGTLVAVKWNPDGAAWLEAHHWVGLPGYPQVARTVAFVGLCLGTCVPFYLAGRVAHKTARAMFLGGVNRLAGIAFGLARGGMVLALLLFATQLSAQHVGRIVGDASISAAVDNLISHSNLGKPLAEMATRIMSETTKQVLTAAGRPA